MPKGFVMATGIISMAVINVKRVAFKRNFGFDFFLRDDSFRAVCSPPHPVCIILFRVRKRAGGFHEVTD
jgi:hypothetical protein